MDLRRGLRTLITYCSYPPKPVQNQESFSIIIIISTTISSTTISTIKVITTSVATIILSSSTDPVPERLGIHVNVICH